MEPIAWTRCIEGRVNEKRRRSLDDGELITRAQRGQTDAYDQLVRRYQEIAFRVAFVITGSASDAEEAAQDGFVKAYFALARFRAGAPFRPWLLQIVANEARNRRRSAARAFTLVLDDAAAARIADPDSSPEERLLVAERAAHLIDCLNQLNDVDRQALAHRYLLDLTEAEMAAALGVARGTVKSRLSRALARARSICQTNRDDHE